MKNISGIGGVFIKAKNPQKLSQWYKNYLGIDLDDNATITFKETNETYAESCTTMFALFSKESNHFSPSESKVMINFRVKNLNKILHDLDIAGVWINENIHYYDYGSFGWTMDPEGNKIELWEPKDLSA